MMSSGGVLSAEIEKFVSVYNELFGRGNAWFQKYRIPLLKENKITLNDALIAFLSNADISDSEKFQFLSKFFDGSDFTGEDPKEVIQSFIDSFSGELQSELDKHVNDIRDKISKMTQEEFLSLIQKVDAVRSVYNSHQTSETTHLLGGLGPLIGGASIPVYRIMKGVKEISRNAVHATVKGSMEKQRLDVFDSMLAYLASGLGNETKHSYKFLLIVAICGGDFRIVKSNYLRNFDSYDIDYTLPDTELGSFIKRALHLYDRPEMIVQAVINKMKEVKQTKSDGLFKQAEDCVKQCMQGRITKKMLADAIEQIKKTKDTASAASYNPFVKIKNAGRGFHLDIVLGRLKDQESPYTVLNGLLDVLSTIGETGPSSLKYQLLITLFPQLKKDDEIISEEKSQNTINYFISQLNAQLAEMKKLESGEIILESKTEEKPRSNGFSPQ